MAPKITCECGECGKCKRREYMREWYRRPGVADKVRATALASRERRIEEVRAYDRGRARRGKSEAQFARNRARVLERQPCERYGTTVRVEGHHPDYSKPLEVIWLCKKHHAEVHRKVF